jgi:predicted nucleotidyltransferase
MNDINQFGILPDDLDSIISILRSNPKVKSVILFGSRAKGSYDPGSDIDIALKGEELNLDDLIGFYIELDKLLIPYKVDIVIFNRIEEQALIEHIYRVGIVLYDKPCQF